MLRPRIRESSRQPARRSRIDPRFHGEKAARPRVCERITDDPGAAQPGRAATQTIGVEMGVVNGTPPSEPDGRISRIRLSRPWGLNETNHK